MMDPDVVLQFLRQYRAGVEDAADDAEAAEYAGLLAEQVGALDEWLSKGGFLPGAWCLRGLPEPAQVTELPVTLTTSDTRLTVQWLVREGRRGGVYWVDDGWATENSDDDDRPEGYEDCGCDPEVGHTLPCMLTPGWPDLDGVR